MIAQTNVGNILGAGIFLGMLIMVIINFIFPGVNMASSESKED